MKKTQSILIALVLAVFIDILSGCQSSNSIEKIESNLTNEQLEIFEYVYDTSNSWKETEEFDQMRYESNLEGEYYAISLYVDQDLYLPENGLDLYKEWRSVAHSGEVKS